MKFTNILVPFDKSEHAMRALEIARGLAKEDAAVKLHVIGIVSVSDYAPALGMDASPYDDLPATMIDPDVYRELVDEAVKREEDAMHEAIGDLLDGLGEQADVLAVNDPSVVDGIVSFADEHRCDLIVMGSRGRGLLRRILGSVSNGVLKEAEIPVLIAKGPEEK